MPLLYEGFWEHARPRRPRFRGQLIRRRRRRQVTSTAGWRGGRGRGAARGGGLGRGCGRHGGQKHRDGSRRRAAAARCLAAWALPAPFPTPSRLTRPDRRRPGSRAGPAFPGNKKPRTRASAPLDCLQSRPQGPPKCDTYVSLNDRDCDSRIVCRKKIGKTPPDSSKVAENGVMAQRRYGLAERVFTALPGDFRSHPPEPIADKIRHRRGTIGTILYFGREKAGECLLFRSQVTASAMSPAGAARLLARSRRATDETPGSHRSVGLHLEDEWGFSLLLPDFPPRSRFPAEGSRIIPFRVASQCPWSGPGVQRRYVRANRRAKRRTAPSGPTMLDDPDDWVGADHPPGRRGGRRAW